MNCRSCFWLCAFFLSVPLARADDPLDRVTDALSFSLFGDKVRTRISGMADAEAYAFDRPAPGLIDTDKSALFNPRLTLFLDLQAGSRVYAFAQGRLDRGFDPSDNNFQLRLDEYAVRVTPWEDGRLSVQAGQFATVVGNWTPRHLSWDNPLITAPLPYDHLTAVYDTEAPGSVFDFVNIHPDERYHYNPVIWGPSYATGLSVAGRLRQFEYAAEIKNTSLSSRPSAWSITDTGFDEPTFSGRLGYRPDMRWNLGVSASTGPYYLSPASPTLPLDASIGDFRQYVLGQDISFAWHRLQLWAEVFESRFEVPHVGDADTLAYYIEAKLGLTPRLSGALRWNQQFFSRIPDGAGGRTRWGDDLWRIDAALRWRFTAHMQLKLQYSLQHTWQSDDFSDLAAAQFTLRF